MAIATLDTPLFVAGASAVLLAVGYLALRLPLATLALLLATWVATDALRDNTNLSIIESGVRVSAVDLICISIVAVALARILSNGVQTLARGLILILSALLAI